MKNETQTAETETVPPHVHIFAVDLKARQLALARLLCASVYRLAVVGSLVALVWRGGSPWLLVLAVLLLAFGPRSR